MSATEQGTSHYELLNVATDASTEDIKRAYRALARRLHPDVAGAGMESLFNQVTRAYEVLSDPNRRAEYDASRTSPPVAEPEPEPWGTEDVIIDEPVDDDPLPPPPPPPPPPPWEQPPQDLPEKLELPAKVRGIQTASWVALAVTFALFIIPVTGLTVLLPVSLGGVTMSNAMFPVFIPVLFRVFLKKGRIALGIVGLLSLPWLGALGPLLGIAVTVVAGEVWRKRIAYRRDVKLARMWLKFRQQAGGREQFVASVAPQGQRTLALLQDLYTGERHQKMIWGVVTADLWIALDEASSVFASCPGEASEAHMRLEAMR